MFYWICFLIILKTKNERIYYFDLMLSAWVLGFCEYGWKIDCGCEVTSVYESISSSWISVLSWLCLIPCSAILPRPLCSELSTKTLHCFLLLALVLTY